MLRTRVLVAAVALPVLTALVLIGGWVFALFVFAAMLLAGWEYRALWLKGQQAPPGWLIYGLIALAFAATWLEEPGWRTPGLIALLIAGMAQAIWDMEHGRATPIISLALAAFGGVYLGWLGSTLVAVRMLERGAYLVIFLYGCVIIADSAAYFVGRRFGRHNLSPRVSPKKTWEGFAGGVVVTPIFGLLVGLLPASQIITPLHGALIGLLISLIGPVGDLGESVIKRQVGVKDSSNLIPGHGGMLDRTDSVLVSFAVGYYYLLWFVL